MALSINYNLVSSGEFQANTCEFDNQLAPDVLGLSNGGFVVAYNSDGISHPVLLEFYDANGQNVADTVIAYNSANITVGQPSLTELANGNVLVVWDDDAVINADIKGRLFTADGDPIGEEIFLTGFASGAGVADPQVTALTGGGFVVSYGYENDLRQRLRRRWDVLNVATLDTSSPTHAGGPERQHHHGARRGRLRRHLDRQRSSMTRSTAASTTRTARRAPTNSPSAPASVTKPSRRSPRCPTATSRSSTPTPAG